MGRGRHQPDYGELFQTHLEQAIASGGYVHGVVELVEIFQRRNERQRRDEFERWLGSTGAFARSRCGYVFPPPSGTAEDDGVLCVSCRT